MDRERYQAFRLTEQQPLSAELGFLAHSAIVDNLTASWLYVQQAGRFVPPFTYGGTFSLGGGVQVAQATWATPPGLTAPTIGTGQAQLVFTSAQLAPANALPVVIPSQQVLCPLTAGTNTTQVSPTSIKTNAAPGGAQTAFATINIPAGANSITIVGQFDTNTTAVGVQGLQTSTQYLTVTAANSPGGIIAPPLFCVFETGADIQAALQITVAQGALLSPIIEVVANFGTQVVAVENAGPPLAVSGLTGGPVAVSLDRLAETPIPKVMGQAVMPVEMWGNANMQVAAISTAINAAATLHVIAANAGVRIYLQCMTLVIREKANVQVAQVQDTSGTAITAMQWDAGAGSNAPAFFDFRGAPLIIGRGLDLVNGGANAASFLGHVTYMTGSS